MPCVEAGETHRSKDDAERFIKQCLQDGAIKETHHFRCELDKEGLSIVDAQIVIRRGYVFDEPELDIRTGEWKYRIAGTAPEGLFVTIVFCIDCDGYAVLITVFCDRAS